MSHVYALQGPGNCGKSSTLIQLFQMVQAKYPAATVQKIRSGTIDVAVVIRGVGGLVVGIESQGDPGSRLKDTLPELATAKCDLIFCACRTNGKTVGWVNDLNPPYRMHFVTQVRVTNNYASTNAATALRLMQSAGI